MNHGLVLYAEQSTNKIIHETHKYIYCRHVKPIQSEQL